MLLFLIKRHAGNQKNERKVAPTKVVLDASDKPPFTLIANIATISDSSCDVQLDFEGEFNPMMAMMIKGPIGKFIEALATNMTKL
jgi:hypothetical protein